MTAAVWVGVAVAVVVGVGWLCRQFATAPYLPEPLTLDEHARQAAALLQPDSPLLDDTPLADALEAWLREHTETATEEF